MRPHRSPNENIGGNDPDIIMAVAVPASDANVMLQDTSKITLANNETAQFTNCFFKISDLINYYNQGGSTYSGLRFYPALTDDQIFSIMCLSNPSNARDYNRVLLTAETNNNLSAVIPKEDAAVYVQNYWDGVLIDTQTQLNTNPFFKKSRYYSWESFLALLSANIPGFDIKNDTSYREYLLKLNQGFVNETLSAKYYSVYNVRLYSNMQQIDLTGYTTLFCVTDSSGTPIILENANYEKGNFTGRYLEMGCACPPECGDTFS